MAEVIVLSHRGRLAALPVSHVQSVLRELPSHARTVNLWSGQDDSHTQYACCGVAGASARYIPCASAKVARLKREQVWPLSHLISRAVARDFLVGMAHHSEGVVWLVDLTQLADG